MIFGLRGAVLPSIFTTTTVTLRSSSPHYLRDIITIQPSRSTRSSSLVTLLHPQAQASLKITNRSFRYVAPHLWNNFLHLFAFLVSRPPQSALLHCQAPTLLLNRWLAYLTGSSILVLKLTFSPDPFPRNLPLSLSNGLISRFLSSTCTEVSGVEIIGQCGRLSQLGF